MTPPTGRGDTYLCELARLPDGTIAREVAVEVVDGRFVRVEPGGAVAPHAVRLSGLVLPGLADGHSHAFHRALRGRTHARAPGGRRGSFWTWRERMYEVAGRLTPERYRVLATAVFAESVLAGVTGVGEFHYLHHGPGGDPYDDPNAFGLALVDAARAAGVRLTLLDTCYLVGGMDTPLTGVQRRFGDGDAARWTARVDALRAAVGSAPDVVVGAAIHSVRAVGADQLATVAGWADDRRTPLHVHLSEQPAENEACLAAHGRTPTGLLDDHGALGPRTTAVHATHLTGRDIEVLGERGGSVCLCPTTERELADGIGPARLLRDAGVALTFGSDSRAVVEPFEEARAAELHLRLATLERGHLDVDGLLDGLTTAGHASLGVADAGRLAVGARADLVAVRLDSVRTAGADPAAAAAMVVFAGAAADVTDVVVDGRRVVTDGRHVLGDLGRRLAAAMRPLLARHGDGHTDTDEAEGDR
ncbi:MAG: formimidoylglutamate deiminase [Nitriliruptoraceae bacterium]|nr:formimidoylglutamate deiminase [Nitriliruptoraceae bacterium]